MGSLKASSKDAFTQIARRFHAAIRDGAAPEMRTFLLPRSDYRIIDDTWDTFGLQGTGSLDIVVERAFVPDYRTHKASDGFACTNPGQAANDGPLYTLPWAQVFIRSVSTAAFGGARAAVDAAVAIMKLGIATSRLAKSGVARCV